MVFEEKGPDFYIRKRMKFEKGWDAFQIVDMNGQDVVNKPALYHASQVPPQTIENVLF